MRFTPDSTRGNYVRSCSPGRIELADRVLDTHAIISVDTVVSDWQPGPIDAIEFADFEPALELKPDIILFGTGTAQRFPNMVVLTEIMKAGVAIEVMQTDAACRTYNVLIGENRAAVAALLVE